MKLHFHGGAEEVTGSNYLVEAGGDKFLVDCGLVQGGRFAEKANWQPFPYNPTEVKAVVITHAHLDHVGRLPKLRREGFNGEIYATHPTLDLARVVLDDSLGIMQENARRMGEEVLFTEEDLIECWKKTHGRNYGSEVQLTPNIKAVFRDAGHILGSSIIELFLKEGEKEIKVVFSGDLGNSPTPFLRPTENILEANYVLVESTYGDRIHESQDERREKLVAAISETVKTGGTLMIPSFALERTQELLYELHRLQEAGEIPKIPVFLDSPMAIRATTVYRHYPDYLSMKASEHLLEHGHDLFNFPGLEFTLTTAASKKINDVTGSKIIIAGSGMSEGGRILHHERRYLPDPNSTLLIIGYQARGTLGRRLLQGSSEVKIFGGEVPVRAKVKAIGGYSAHADQAGLLRWVGAIKKKPQKVFCVQGEANPALALALKIKDKLGISAEVPKENEVVEL